MKCKAEDVAKKLYGDRSTQMLPILKEMVKIGNESNTELRQGTAYIPGSKTDSADTTTAKKEKDRPNFDKLPEYKEGQNNFVYAGIGSRETPKETLSKMTEVSKFLDKLGYKLQTGKTFKNKEEGADKAFSDGTDNKELFRPESITPGSVEMQVAEEIHPNFNAMKDGGKKLMARNTNQVFGKDLNQPVDFVLFYAEETDNPLRPKGGTGQAVEMARRKGIPTINMAKEGWEQELRDVLGIKEEQKELTAMDKIFGAGRKAQAKNKEAAAQKDKEIKRDHIVKKYKDKIVRPTKEGYANANIPYVGRVKNESANYAVIRGLDTIKNFGNPFVIQGVKGSGIDVRVKGLNTVEDVTGAFSNWITKNIVPEGYPKDKLADLEQRRNFIIENFEMLKDKDFIYPGSNESMNHAFMLKHIAETSSVKQPKNTINVYYGSNENAHLSNFAERPFNFLGIDFHSVEQAFQYAKSIFSDDQIEQNKTVRRVIEDTKNGKRLKELGREYKKFDSKAWDEQSEGLMKQMVLESFRQNPDALKRLLDTGDAVLTHKQDKSKWKLVFPAILMEVREELRNDKTGKPTKDDIIKSKETEAQIKDLEKQKPC